MGMFDGTSLRRSGFTPPTNAAHAAFTVYFDSGAYTEQTDRMRAAIAHVATVSKSQYSDLAAFWNECLKTAKYDPLALRDRLRKGHVLNRTAETAKGLLEHWTMIYNLDLRAVFPGPFPPSRELEELWLQRLKETGP